MKKLLIIAFAIALSSCTQNKIAYVDFTTVMKDYDAMVTLREEATVKQDEITGKLELMQAQFQAKVQEYYQNAEKMSVDKRAEAEQALGQEQQMIQSAQQQMSQMLQQENEAKTVALFSRLDSLVIKFTKSQGFNLVLGTQGNTTVIYGDEQLNITSEIVEMLNKDYHKTDDTEEVVVEEVIVEEVETDSIK
jgi:outer membrane protein